MYVLGAGALSGVKSAGADAKTCVEAASLWAAGVGGMRAAPLRGAADDVEFRDNTVHSLKSECTLGRFVVRLDEDSVFVTYQ